MNLFRAIGAAGGEAARVTRIERFVLVAALLSIALALLD